MPIIVYRALSVLFAFSALPTYSFVVVMLFVFFVGLFSFTDQLLAFGFLREILILKNHGEHAIRKRIEDRVLRAMADIESASERLLTRVELRPVETASFAWLNDAWNDFLEADFEQNDKLER
jgi:hypothetical protein